MNILVRTFEGRHVVRPDTTWENDNDNFFPPDYIDSLTFSPVIFARICKPGRFIGEKYTLRYYDSASFGILLYPEDLIVDALGYAEAIAVDHISHLPVPLMKVEDCQEGRLRISSNGTSILELDSPGKAAIEKAIVSGSTKTYLKTGDLIAVELAPRAPLCSRADGNLHIEAIFKEHKILDFNIIY